MGNALVNLNRITIRLVFEKRILRKISKKNCASGKTGFGNLFNRKIDNDLLNEDKKLGYVFRRGCLNVIWEWVDISLFAVFGINVLATLATCWLCCFDQN